MVRDPRDYDYLWDIAQAARELQEFTRGVSQTEYEADRKLQLAVERLLEIIGEASRRLSEGCRAEFEEVPWTRIVGLRNVLTHEYGRIRQDIIWRVATRRVPELLAALERRQSGS